MATTIKRRKRNYSQLGSEFTPSSVCRSEILIPAAECLLQLVEESFKAEDASTLELLDAERSLVQVRREALEASRTYHCGAAELLLRY